MITFTQSLTWRFIDGMPAAPTHWSALPKGPEA